MENDYRRYMRGKAPQWVSLMKFMLTLGGVSGAWLVEYYWVIPLDVHRSHHILLTMGLGGLAGYLIGVDLDLIRRLSLSSMSRTLPQLTMLSCLLFLTKSTVASPTQRSSDQDRPLPFHAAEVVSVTMQLKKLPGIWPKSVPHPRKITRVTVEGVQVYALFWSGAQLWIALPSDEKKHIKGAADMVRYYQRLMLLATPSRPPSQ